MHYYIDGYNLLFRILKTGDNLRKQREELTIDIEKKVNLLELEATLVFDSHYQPDENTKSHLHSLEIIFTAKGESADEFILQELKESSNPSQYTVVTSDKKLASLCRLRLAKTENIDEFLAWINKRYKNKLCQVRTKEKESLKPTLPAEQKKSVTVPPPPSLNTAVSRLNSPEACFDFYLDIFEKETLELQKQAPSPKKAPQEPRKPKVKKRQLSEKEAQLSDLERWQKTFEKDLSDDPECRNSK